MPMFRCSVRAAAAFLPLLWGVTGTGCGGKISTEEKTEFARLYAEVLIIENIYPNDSARREKAVDSLLNGTEFGGREEMEMWIHELTVADPKGLQEMMDSTQKYLERVRDHSRKKEAGGTDTTAGN